MLIGRRILFHKLLCFMSRHIVTPHARKKIKKCIIENDKNLRHAKKQKKKKEKKKKKKKKKELQLRYLEKNVTSMYCHYHDISSLTSMYLQIG